MHKIRLPRDGTEYAIFTFSPSRFPAGTVLEAEIEGAWYVLDTSGEEPRLLLKGPLASAGGVGVPVTRDGPIRVRVKAAPETVVRGAGYIALVG